MSTATRSNTDGIHDYSIIGYLISPEKRMNRKASGLMGNLVNERLAMDDEERPVGILHLYVDQWSYFYFYPSSYRMI